MAPGISHVRGDLRQAEPHGSAERKLRAFRCATGASRSSVFASLADSRFEAIVTKGVKRDRTAPGTNRGVPLFGPSGREKDRCGRFVCFGVSVGTGSRVSCTF